MRVTTRPCGVCALQGGRRVTASTERRRRRCLGDVCTCRLPRPPPPHRPAERQRPARGVSLLVVRVPVRAVVRLEVAAAHDLDDDEREYLFKS